MPKSPAKPTLAKAVVKVAVSAASRRSQASARPKPAPAQGPLTAAMLTFGLSCSSAAKRWEKTSHRRQRTNRNELDPILVLQGLHLLSWFQAEGLSNSAGYDDLKFGGNGHGIHWHPHR